MNSFELFFKEKVFPLFSNINVPQIIELCLIAFALFMFYDMLNKHNAVKISFIFIVYAILVSIISLMLETSLEIYLLFIISFIISTVVMFSTEIKRSVWKGRSTKNFSTSALNAIKDSSKQVNDTINEIIKALLNMSKKDVGAIIVLSNTKMPNNIIDSGVKIDANISSALIESIFFPKTALHDGAIIIQNHKIQAAGCFLPLSQDSDLPKDLGTRHRAGIGVTETLNVTAIIVSEETGIISYARGGQITRYVDIETLRKILKEYYWEDIYANGKGGK